MEGNVENSLKGLMEAESAEGFLQLVMESLAEPVTVIDRDFRILWMNSAAERFLRKGPHRTKYLFCYRCHHGRETPCDGVEYPCPLEKLRESEGPLTTVHEHHLPDGTRRFFEIISTALRDGDGGFMGIVEAQRDVNRAEDGRGVAQGERGEVQAASKLRGRGHLRAGYGGKLHLL